VTERGQREVWIALIICAYHLDAAAEHSALGIHLPCSQFDATQLIEAILCALTAHRRLNGHEDGIVVCARRHSGCGRHAKGDEGHRDNRARADHAGFLATANSFMKS
jgi:hypothetical protein